MSVGPRRGQAAITSALALAAAAMAGCGSGGAATVTRAQALAYAESAGLRAGDVPGETAFLKAGPVTGAPLGVVINRCGAKLPLSSERAMARSQTFVRPARSVGLMRSYERGHLYSDVYVLDSEAAAKQAVAAVAAPRTLACMAATYRKAHALTSEIRVAPLMLKLAGGSAEGIRETGATAVSDKAGTPRAHFQVDTIVFAVGPAVVRLNVAGIGGDPPTAAERPAVELLMRRARRLQL